VYEIGILFDIEGLGSSLYGRAAYRILFESLDPQRLKGCSLHDGDTNATLMGKANLYCVAIRCPEPETLDYVREALSAREDEGLLPVDRRFVTGAVTAREPLVQAGDVNKAGKLIVDPNDAVAASQPEGTAWKVVSPRRLLPWRRGL